MEPCRTIELGCDGWLVPQIADQVGRSQKTVRRWLPRARELGIEVSRSRVRRILPAEGVRWRRTRSWPVRLEVDAPGRQQAELNAGELVSKALWKAGIPEE
ncbi:helix-turn-helix domain-containing protein [Streptomyces sp. MUSC 14]|uniref:helix-turn-helix domain-containing protein n=1 Tax=Streptomyces sp. MUSC 14 TaxID=1354889 RepID=UPI0011609DBB|nr:helix-turn-helix domain-containing protein [Streptomyces sp. MUSC 14]